MLDYCLCLISSIGFQKVSKRRYNKTEKALRHQIFRSNLQFIRKHNKARRESFHLGLNRFTDKTEEEFKRTLGFKSKRSGKAIVRYPRPKDDGKTVDLRDTGCIGKVQNQGDCGSCYAFATVENADSVHCLTCNTSTVQYVSPQNIVDCSQKQGNFGCDGGWMESVVDYMKAAPGINLLSDYPYTAKEGTCQFNNQTAVYRKVTGHNEVKADENEMMRVLDTLKTPLYVAIKVDKFFQMYQGGVFGNFGVCKTQPWQLNHAVQVVGYGRDKTSKKLYWLVKNTWSEDWGEDGYIRVWRTGCCLGICQVAGYASIDCDQ